MLILVTFLILLSNYVVISDISENSKIMYFAVLTILIILNVLAKII